MKKRKLFTSLLLLLGSLTGGSGAMAQNGWDAITNQTQTTSDDWTPLTEGSTDGKVLGASGTTTYYYLKKSLNFTNNRTDNDGNGNSGLKIQGTVYLYIPTGLTMTCVGANADGRTGAGAGIELASGNTLYIIGGGTVNAHGGNAANGKDGNRGGDAGYSYNSWIKTGAGGTGGNGGGGAGAGIGTRGGTGGTGGAGGAGQQPDYLSHTNGTNGTGGSNGNTAGSMGNLYVANGITVTATGGSAATEGGSGGWRGTCAVENSVSKNYSMAGGGGGGGGGFGGAASNVGTGGPGGGGGGGGAGGTQERCSSGYLVVYAPGGKAGKNADGSNAQDGEDAYIYGDWQQGWLISNSNWSSSDWDGDHDATAGTEGSGGSQGSASSNGTQNAGKKEYNITYNPIKTKVNGSNTNPVTFKYTPGAASVILPRNIEGYQWLLYVYGKDCRPNNVTNASEFTTASQKFYGGNVSDADRTILLSDVYGDIVFQEVATVCNIENLGNNEQLLTDFYNNGEVNFPITVRLKDRTLYRDNHWNTLCLPFDMTPAQIATSPLKGASIYELDKQTSGYYPNGVTYTPMNINYNYPVVLLYFNDAEPGTNGIKKGQPYLVRWAEKATFTNDGNLVDNTTEGNGRHELDFTGVMVRLIEASEVSGTGFAGSNSSSITFKGTFSSSADLEAGDKTRLMLGSEDLLYYPSKTINVGACRAYFILPSAAVASARQVVMGFKGEDETTSIQTINIVRDSQYDAPVYNLNGQRLSAPRKGINIVNGKKVLVK